MKPKQLVPLIIVLAVLAGLVFVRQASNRPPSLEQQYALHTLLPEGIDTASLTKIEMYAGAKPDEKVVLERAPGATTWTIGSAFGAPVSQEKIDGYLKTLKKLQGEFRADVSEEGFKEYNVDNESGFHVVGYGEGGHEAQFHLVNGKSPDFGKAFARLESNSEVYVIDVSLRREAGIFTVEMGDAPQPTTWLDKKVLELEADKIKAVTLEYPDKSIALELQKKEPEPKPESGDAEEAEDAGDAPADESGDAAAEGEQIEEWNWVVTQGGPDAEFHSNAASNLARRLTRVSATDVVDPAKKAEWKLDPPQYRATITVEGRESPVVLEAGRPADSTYAYVQLGGAERDVVYKVSGYDFEQIFQHGSEFFELPGVLVESKDVDRIEYAADGRHVTLAKVDGAWKVTAPKTEVPVEQTAVDRLARTLLAWKAQDYADAGDGKGLENSADRIQFSGPEVSHTIVLGGTTADDGRYVRLDGGDEILVMSEADVAAICPPYSKLFNPSVFDVDEAAIEEITISKGEASFRLDRTGDDAWNIIEGGSSEPADLDKVFTLVSSLVGLRADALDFPEMRAPGDIFGTVSFTLDDDTELKMTVERSADAVFSVTKPGVNAVYTVPGSSVARIFAEPAELKPEPAAPAESPASDADADAEADADAGTPEENAEDAAAAP